MDPVKNGMYDFLGENTKILGSGFVDLNMFMPCHFLPSRVRQLC